MEGMEKACDRHTICQYTSMKRQGRYICCRTLTSWSKLGALNHMWPCGWTSIQQVLRSWWAAKSAWWSNFCQTNCSHKPNAECADSTAPPFVRHRTRTSQHRNESTHGERKRERERVKKGKLLAFDTRALTNDFMAILRLCRLVSLYIVHHHCQPLICSHILRLI